MKLRRLPYSQPFHLSRLQTPFVQRSQQFPCCFPGITSSVRPHRKQRRLSCNEKACLAFGGSENKAWRPSSSKDFFRFSLFRFSLFAFRLLSISIPLQKLPQTAPTTSSVRSLVCPRPAHSPQPTTTRLVLRTLICICYLIWLSISWDTPHQREKSACCFWNRLSLNKV